jgi:hypothetical protein
LKKLSLIDCLTYKKRINIIVSERYGFKENSTTELAIFDLTNQILTQVNKKSSVESFVIWLKP